MEGEAMKNRPKVLTEQIITRVPPELKDWLERDADNNGRTMAQSVRWHLEIARYNSGDA